MRYVALAGLFIVAEIFAVVVSLQGWGGALVTSALPLLALAIALQGPLDSGLLWYAVLVALVDTLKRLVFLFAPSQTLLQYAPMAVTYAATLVLGLRGLVARVQGGKLDGIDKAFGLYLLMGIIGNLASPHLSTEIGLFKALYELPPLLIFYAFRVAAEDGAFVTRWCSAVTKLGLIAAVYGMAQFVFGPSPVDRVWAEASWNISVEARNVWNAVHIGGIMRPYSLLADHFTFGYFLVAAFVALQMSRWPRPVAGRVFVGAILLLALATALTRAAWVSLALTVGAYFVLAKYSRALQRSLPVLVLLCYVLAALATGYAYENLFPQQSFDDPLAAQAFSLGTLSARYNAPEAFVNAAKRYPLLGDGGASGAYVVTAKFSGDLVAESQAQPFDDAHNFLIWVIVSRGLPGLAAFLLFYFWCLKNVLQDCHIREIWAGAAMIGLLVAGVAAGATFFSAFFLAWCGMAASAPRRHGAA